MMSVERDGEFRENEVDIVFVWKNGAILSIDFKNRLNIKLHWC